MKEIHLILMKGKISKISSLRHFHFSPKKVHREENKFLTEIYTGKCLHLFTIQNSLQIPRTIFQLYHQGYFMADVMQNPCRLSIFGFVSKPEVEGAFQNRKPGLFSF